MLLCGLIAQYVNSTYLKSVVIKKNGVLMNIPTLSHETTESHDKTCAKKTTFTT